MSVSVCVSVTAVSRQPLVRSNWNLPGIVLGPCGCAFSRFDINRTSGSQVMAIYLPNQWQDTMLWRHDWRHNWFFFVCCLCTYGHARTATFLRSRVPVRAWSGSSHIAVTIIRNLVLMANYSISANIFCLFAMSSQGKTQREEKRKKKRSCKKK